MQVSVKNSDVLAFLLTDHSPITFSYYKIEEAIEVEASGNLITA